MPAPLIDKLIELNNSNPVSFHMPGHKRKKKYIPYDLLSFDFTEIEGLDNLCNPKGIIRESQRLCAELFGADSSFYLVNGSTSGLLAAVTALCGPEDKILMARNCHKSVYNAVILSGTVPVYIYPEITFFGAAGTISPSSVKEALDKNNDIKAAVVTNPTYEGLCSDILAISNILHEKNIPLIVDEAHGAHFNFSDKFPQTALSLGADIVIQSFHKTLPALTQTAVLHLKSKIVDKNRLAYAVSMYTSSSPSYIFMALLDNCQNILSRKADELFENYTGYLEKFYSNTRNLKNIYIPSKFDILRKTSAFDADFGKIICLINNKSVFNVENYLKKYYNIIVEMKGLNYLLFMTSFCDEQKDFETLENAIKQIDSCLSLKFPIPENINKSPVYPICAISPLKAFHAEYKKIPFEKSAGFILAEFLTPYPPGIPVAVPGEIITSEIIELVLKYKNSGIEISGCENKNVDFINVIVQNGKY